MPCASNKDPVSASIDAEAHSIATAGPRAMNASSDVQTAALPTIAAASGACAGRTRTAATPGIRSANRRPIRPKPTMPYRVMRE